MRPQVTVIGIVELALIAALSGSGTYAFINSGLYGLLQGAIEASYPLLASYLPLILWGLLFSFGLFTITFKGQGSGSLAWLVSLFSLPLLLGYNSVNWLGIFGMEFKLSAGLGFYEMLGLAVLIIAGYVVLSHMRLFKQARRNLINREASPEDVASVNLYSHLMLLLVIGVALALAAAIGLLSRNLEFLTLDYLEQVPWNVVTVGLVSILVLAAYLYWLGARRKPRA